MLGTANLVTKYGIANQNEMSNLEAELLINHSIKSGIRSFDTAPSYGNAEEILGGILVKNLDIRVYTKFSSNSDIDLKSAIKSIEESREKLRIKQIYCVLFHNPNAHLDKNFRNLVLLILERGLAQKVGISCYDKAQVISAKSLCPELTVFQLPENIANRKYFDSSELLNLSKSGNEILVRSIFLQGLLLMDPLNLNRKFDDAAEAIRKLSRIADEYQISISDLCMSYAISIPWATSILVSAANISQLDQITNFKKVELNFDNFPIISNKILDPRNWDNL